MNGSFGLGTGLTVVQRVYGFGHRSEQEFLPPALQLFVSLELVNALKLSGQVATAIRPS